MTPDPDAGRRAHEFLARRFCWAQLATAFASLLAVKVALVGHVVFSEGGTPSHFAKIFMCLGWDVVGAVVFAGLVSGAALPLGRRFGPRPAHVVAGLLQALHAFYLVVSYYVARALGSPFTKSVIDLAFVNTDAPASGAGSAVWSSIQQVATVSTIVFLVTATGVAVVLPLLLYRRPPRLSRAVRTVAAALAAAAVVFTVLVLPNIRNGEYLGVRIHTYGLERSHFLGLVASYATPPLRGLFARKRAAADPFCFSYASLAGPREVPANPLLRPGVPGADPARASAPRHTNLVFVILESTAAGQVEAEPTPMPFVHQLAARPGGLQFGRHYSHWPATMKSYFNLFCSEMPHPDYPPITYVNPAIPSTSISEALHDHGYRTGMFWSQDLAYDRQMRFFQHRKLDVVHDLKTMPGREGRWSYSWGIDDAVTLQASLRWVDETAASGKPFALFIATAAGHHPYLFPGAPEPRPGLKAERAAYLRALGYIDERIRELHDGLAARKLLDDTLVVVTSDHGEAFGEHPMDLTHGIYIYDQATHVPLFMFGPQLREVRGKVEFVTAHIDVAPTVLGLLDVPVPMSMKGRDLTRERASSLVIFKSRPPVAQIGLRDGDWKYIYTAETNTRELFDLGADPLEQVNVATTHADLCARFHAHLEAWDGHSRDLIENYASILGKSGRACRK
jgi:arylsulfatase A-like enzyme